MYPLHLVVKSTYGVLCAHGAQIQLRFPLSMAERSLFFVSHLNITTSQHNISVNFNQPFVVFCFCSLKISRDWKKIFARHITLERCPNGRRSNIASYPRRKRSPLHCRWTKPFRSLFILASATGRWKKNRKRAIVSIQEGHERVHVDAACRCFCLNAASPRHSICRAGRSLET